MLDVPIDAVGLQVSRMQLNYELWFETPKKALVGSHFAAVGTSIVSEDKLFPHGKELLTLGFPQYPSYYLIFYPPESQGDPEFVTSVRSDVIANQEAGLFERVYKKTLKIMQFHASSKLVIECHYLVSEETESPQEASSLEDTPVTNEIPEAGPVQAPKMKFFGVDSNGYPL